MVAYWSTTKDGSDPIGSFKVIDDNITLYAIPSDAENPVQIYTPMQLYSIYENATTLAASYILKNDLTVTITDNTNKSKIFTGSFDGGGFTVTYNNDKNTNTHPLFDKIGSGSTVENLTVDGGITRSTALQYAYGGIINTCNGGTIKNCTNKVSLTVGMSPWANESTSKRYVGGIVGLITAVSTLSELSNEGTITGTLSGYKDTAGAYYGYVYAGGIVGCDEAGSTISDCANEGTVTGGNSVTYGNKVYDDTKHDYAYLGGIIGFATNTTLTNCTSSEAPTLIAAVTESGNTKNATGQFCAGGTPTVTNS